jgi:hypothetical protein
VVRRFSEEKIMKKRNFKKLVHEGKFVAEVAVDLIENNEGWSPYLSIEDAYKLDDVRGALRRGDIKAAARLGRVYKLTPVSKEIFNERDNGRIKSKLSTRA